MHNQNHRSQSTGFKDLWVIAREGSLSELDAALAFIKKNGGDVDCKNICGLTPLHIATWRNNVPIVRRLLTAGANPDIRDGESGWTSLHRALHFGHFVVASILLQAGASLLLEDLKGNFPVDFLRGHMLTRSKRPCDSELTEVFSWGSGTNYQLGTGNAHMQKLPGKIDVFQDSNVRFVAAAKFHSVAVCSNGELYSWGYGRGGRLGYPDFDIHSGQAAVITPRQVTSGLGLRRVRAVAAAKHHTVITVDNGDVFTWGSNREGQLGYGSVDTQPIPRRVSSLKARIVAVTAANKHSAAVSDSGEVFTWGGNKLGQLGYGTSNSTSNCIPRVVESLKGRLFVKISAAKHHTVALSEDGEVFTWGYRLVTPRRVVIGRSTRKHGSSSMKYPLVERLHAVSVAAGMCHSTILADNGSLFYWVSSDPDLKCHQLYSLSRKNVVEISAGKYWTAIVTEAGDVFMWDGKQKNDEMPGPVRLMGVKRAASVCVGETHLLIICSIHHPAYHEKLDDTADNHKVENEFEDQDFSCNEVTGFTSESISCGQQLAPSLRCLCMNVAAKYLVEPRNVLQLYEIADRLDAIDLKRYCEGIAIHNLDYIFATSSSSVANTSPEILGMLEMSIYARSSETWSYHQLPSPTAPFPLVINSEDSAVDTKRVHCDRKLCLENCNETKFDAHFDSTSASVQDNMKHVRALRKKLQQIYTLLSREASGYILDDQQKMKVQNKVEIESELAELGFPTEVHLRDGMGEEKKVKMPKKQQKNVRSKGRQLGALLQYPGVDADNGSSNEFLDAGVSHVAQGKGIAIHNLDYIFATSSSSVANTSPEILGMLEMSIYARSSETWSYHQLPSPTAPFPLVINSEDSAVDTKRVHCDRKLCLENCNETKFDAHFDSTSASVQDNMKHVRALRKKLQQIYTLLSREASGYILDDQQKMKVQNKVEIESELAELGFPTEVHLRDGMGEEKKVKMPKKQQKNVRSKGRQLGALLKYPGVDADNGSSNEFLDAGVSHVAQGKVAKNNLKAVIPDFNEKPADVGNAFSVSGADSRNVKTSLKKKKKKGGLSMFLGGALDDAHDKAAAPLIHKSEGPAWGGINLAKRYSSLREIQNEQSKNDSTNLKENLPSSSSCLQVELSLFLPKAKSKPVDMVSRSRKNNPVSWGTNGVLSPPSMPSLREIQSQQEKHLKSNVTPSNNGASSLTFPHCQSSPPETSGKSRWFKPETEVPQSTIRCIQVEERAMKDLKRFYSSVRLVKTQSPSS